MRRWGRTHRVAAAVAAAVMAGMASAPARADGAPVAAYWFVGTGTRAAALWDWGMRCSPDPPVTSAYARAVPEIDSVYHDLRKYPVFSLRLHWWADSTTTVNVAATPEPAVAFGTVELWAQWVYNNCDLSPVMPVKDMLRNGHDFYIPMDARGVIFHADAGAGRVRLDLTKVP